MEGKYVFIADMHGQCPVFMEYSAEYSVFSWHGEVKKCVVQKTQKFEDAAENARARLVRNMRSGAHMVWNCDTMVPDFSKYDSKTLPLKNKIFNREWLMEKDNYLSLVKESENHDLQNNNGFYEMNEKFNICVMMNMTDTMMDDEIV